MIITVADKLLDVLDKMSSCTEDMLFVKETDMFAVLVATMYDIPFRMWRYDDVEPVVIYGADRKRIAIATVADPASATLTFEQVVENNKNFIRTAKAVSCRCTKILTKGGTP